MKILIITDMPPCTNHTSGIVMNKWCDFLLEEKHKVFCALVKDPNVTVKIPKEKINNIKFLKLDKPREYWSYDKPGKFYKGLSLFRSFVCNNFSTLFILPTIKRKIVKFAKENDIDSIFCSMQGQTITRLVRPVAQKLKKEYVAQTWDPLEWWLKDFKFDKITAKFNMNEYGKVIQNAKVFMAMSWAMSVEYSKKYTANCVTNLPGLQYEKIDYNKAKNEIFSIGFAGQVYAKEEITILIKTLRKMKWKYKNKEIKLNLYGVKFNVDIEDYDNILIHGYLQQEKLLTELGKADLLYCPYWFDKDYIEPTRLSFPGKLTSYLKLGKPVLIHAPQYASPRIILEKNKAAYICDSLDIAEMEKLLCYIIEDEESEIIAKRGLEVFKKYLTYEQMKKSLFVSLGLQKKDELEDFERVRKLYETS